MHSTLPKILHLMLHTAICCSHPLAAPLLTHRAGTVAHLGNCGANNIEYICSNLVNLAGELVVRVLDLLTKHLHF